MADPAVPVDRTPLDLAAIEKHVVDSVPPLGAPVSEIDRVHARFIARAREDVPALVAEVERLRAELADHHCDCLAGKIAEVRADRDRLAAQVQAVEALCDEAVFTIALHMPDGVITYPKVVTVPKLRAALAVPAATEEGDES